MARKSMDKMEDDDVSSSLDVGESRNSSIGMPLLYQHSIDHKKPSTAAKKMTILFLFFLSCFALFSLKFPNRDAYDMELPLGTKRLWGLLKNIRVQDIKGIPRSWSEYYCPTSRGSMIMPRCEGEQHSCVLANLIFNQFRTLYAPKTQPGRSAATFPHTTFHMDNSQGGISDNDRHAFVEKIMDHMIEATKEKHHLMWLVEVSPDHGFIIEQEGRKPDEFRLYQSWMYGFDINYWLSEATTDEPCYEHNWGTMDEFKYDKEKNIGKAMRGDLEALKAAKARYGSHRTFDTDAFEEIFFKLTWGWKMLDNIDAHARLRSMMDERPTTPVWAIMKSKPMWSLKHIFGLEPICLKSLEENRPLHFGITVQTLDLGTVEMVEQIEPKQSEMEKMNVGLENVHLVEPGSPPKTDSKPDSSKSSPQAPGSSDAGPSEKH